MTDTTPPPDSGKLEQRIAELESQADHLLQIIENLKTSLDETLKFTLYLIKDVEFTEVQHRYDYRGNSFVGFKSRAEKAIAAARAIDAPVTVQPFCDACDRPIDKSGVSWRCNKGRYYCNDDCFARANAQEVHVDH